MDREELLAFVEEVRRTTGKALSRLAYGHTEDARKLIAGIGQKAACIVNQEKMQAESSAEHRYDLTTLPKPDSTDAPE